MVLIDRKDLQYDNDIKPLTRNPKPKAQALNPKPYPIRFPPV